MKKLASSALLALSFVVMAPAVVLLALSRLMAWIVSPIVMAIIALAEKSGLDSQPCYRPLEWLSSRLRRFVD